MGEIRGIYLDLPYQVFLDDHYPKGTHIVVQYARENIELDEAGELIPTWTYKDESNTTWFLSGGKPVVLLNSEQGESLDNFVDRFLDQTEELHEDTYVYTTGGPTMIAKNIWSQKGGDDPLEVRRAIRHYSGQGLSPSKPRIEEFIEDLKGKTHPVLYSGNFGPDFYLQ